MKKKALLLILLTALATVTLTGCNFGKSYVSESVQKKNSIIDGEYIVLDTREQIGGTNVRISYHLTMILQDSNGERFYYEYISRDEKNNEYIHLAKFSPGDNVSYKDGSFTFIDELHENTY